MFCNALHEAGADLGRIALGHAGWRHIVGACTDEPGTIAGKRLVDQLLEMTLVGGSTGLCQPGATGHRDQIAALRGQRRL